MNAIVLILILLAVAFNTVAQLALKAGIDKIGQFEFTWHNVWPIAWQIMLNPWIVFGMVVYVGSVGVWLMVLSRAPVSMAYPMASLGYITSAIAAYFLLGENLSLIRITGIIVILIGVFMVARS
jgi:drug/metabolite transporter (DMT)-like permease